MVFSDASSGKAARAMDSQPRPTPGLDEATTRQRPDSFSGPTPDRKFGIYVIKAESRAEADQIAASDPYTAAGLCQYDLYEWEVHQVMGAGPFSAAELRTHR